MASRRDHYSVHLFLLCCNKLVALNYNNDIQLTVIVSLKQNLGIGFRFQSKRCIENSKNVQFAHGMI